MPTVFDGVPRLEPFSVQPALSAFAAGRDMRMENEDRATAEQDKIAQIVANAAYQADTPEKWSQFIGVLSKRFPGKDLSPFADFNARESLIAQGPDRMTPYQEAQLANERERIAIARRADARAGAPGAPDLETLYDPETGLEYKAAWNPDTQSYERMGGVKAPSGTQLSVDPATGAVSFMQGTGLKPLTEGQSKDTVFVTRATGALPIINKFGDELTSLPQSVAGRTPLVGNYAKSPEFQQAEQAGKEFLQAILRKDTGAAITEEETEEYGSVYLPRPGDSPEVLAQKKLSRQRAIDAIRAGMPASAIVAAERAMLGGNPEMIQGDLTVIQSDEDYEALPSGTHFIAPDGTERVKP